MYGSVTMMWKTKEMSRIRAEQMYNLRVLLGIRRMNSAECIDRRAVWMMVFFDGSTY